MDIWLYWDNTPGQTAPPTYIQLCWETIRKHCGKDFDIHLVTTENVRQFLPSIADNFFQIAQINNKSNFLRYTLLKEHGGIWLDSDLILFQSLKPTLDLLKDGIDLVATASPTLQYGEPECGFLLSTKNGDVITKAVSVVEYALNLQPPGHIFTWGSLGPKTIRQAVKGKKYHHLDCRLISPVPSWEAFRFAGKESIDKYCIDGSYGCMLFHEMFKQYNSPFLRMNRQQLLESPTLLGQMFRKALNES
jgi:mannosyltransferase OCH1-like enzyme